MTAGVVFHTAGRNFLHIQTGIEDAFLIPERLCSFMAEWINDAASTAAYDFRQPVDLIPSI